MTHSGNHPLTVFAAAVVLAAAIVGFSTASASFGAASGVCGTFTGPAWKSRSYHKSGTLYQVSSDKVSCAFARNWSKKLVRKPSHGSGSALAGPAGWTCVVHPSALDFTRAFAVWGRCDKGSTAFARGPVFTWFPKLA
jgi:hypothetical protein